MKPLVLFHAACADGFGAAFAAWLKLGDEAEYLPMNYGEVPTIEDWHMRFALGADGGRDVYILDFSFPKSTMEHLLSHAAKVVWLDHHKSAFESWCGGIPEHGLYTEGGVNAVGGGEVYITLNNNKSGAMLAWEYFHPETEVPMLIEHIDDYDRWQFRLENTKPFNKALWSRTPWSFEQWRTILSWEWIQDPRYQQFITEGSAILRTHNQNVQAVLKASATDCNIYMRNSGLPSSTTLAGRMACCPRHLASDVGHELAVQSGTFGLTWLVDSEGKVRCSIRSNGDYDVSVIAKHLGGGGHLNASGFEVDLATLRGWMKV